MIKAIFFDLDGTLLPLNERKFAKIYFKTLYKKVKFLKISKMSFFKALYKGALAQVKNDGTRTNEEVFWESIKNTLGMDLSIYKDVLNEYYQTSYLKTTKTCEKNDEDNTTNSCFAGTSYRAISGNSSTMSCSEKSYVLANSSSICVTAFTNGEDTNSSARPYLKVIMDSNGSEKPNIGGRDMFTFYIDRTGTLRGDKPEKDDDDDNTGSTNSCTTSAFGEGCLTKLEENNWKMVY